MGVGCGGTPVSGRAWAANPVDDGLSAAVGCVGSMPGARRGVKPSPGGYHGPMSDLVLGTAGHIDHGKTALVRALTGVDTDRLPAEKRRGITIDLGFARLDAGPHRLALVDVPGHERFVRNMLAGATGLDLALLVVAADDSVMPQTREHLEILKLMRLAGGVVALTKCDLADPAWLRLVEDEVRALISGTFLADAEVIPTSTATGRGIDALKAALARLADATPARPDVGLFRMAIDRAFTVAGHGTVVTGTVASGVVAVGDELTWHPEGRPVRVRGLQRDGHPAATLGRGTRAAVNLGGVHHAEVARGQELAAPGYLAPTRTLSVELRASLDAPRPLRHRSRYRLHLGTAEVAATLALIEGSECVPGEVMLAQLHLATPVVAVYGQPLVLREESPPATLGGGRVLEPTARRVRRRDAPAIDRLRRLADADPSTRLAAALASRGLDRWTIPDLARESDIPADLISRYLDNLTRSGRLVALPIGPRRSSTLPAETVAALEARIVKTMARLHAAKPRQSALRRPDVLSAFPDLGREGLVAAILDRLRAAGTVVGDARAVALRSFEPRLSQNERKLKAELAAALKAGGMSPPDLADLAAKAGPRAAVVPELLALLVDEGHAVEVARGLFLDADADAALRKLVADRLADGSSMTMAELRDLLATTRKYAVPIGEYLDKIGLTVREGDARRLGVAPT